MISINCPCLLPEMYVFTLVRNVESSALFLYKVFTRHLTWNVSSWRFLQFSYLMPPLSFGGITCKPSDICAYDRDENTCTYGRKSVSVYRDVIVSLELSTPIQFHNHLIYLPVDVLRKEYLLESFTQVYIVSH